MSKEKGGENFLAFKNWIEERYKTGDWNDYIRGSRLNRSEIAKECGFSLNVFKANGNKEIRALLSQVENYLLSKGILKEAKISDEEALANAESRRTAFKNKKAQENELELELLRAEVDKLKNQLAHMRNTGLFIPE